MQLWTIEPLSKFDYIVEVPKYLKQLKKLITLLFNFRKI